MPMKARGSANYGTPCIIGNLRLILVKLLKTTHCLNSGKTVNEAKQHRYQSNAVNIVD